MGILGTKERVEDKRKDRENNRERSYEYSKRPPDLSGDEWSDYFGIADHGMVFLVLLSLGDLSVPNSTGEIFKRLRDLGSVGFYGDPGSTGGSSDPSRSYRLSGRCVDIWTAVGLCLRLCRYQFGIVVCFFVGTPLWGTAGEKYQSQEL